MALLVNLRHLAVRTVALRGELPVEGGHADSRDPLIQLHQPLAYDLEVEKVDDLLLVSGSLRIVLDCQCVRCLEPFAHEIRLTGPLCELPLTGEEKVPVVNDCVDLTPHLWDDIFLEFPPHPLCNPECRGLSVTTADSLHQPAAADPASEPPSAWDVLKKLKL